jgi:hypothetical protein
VADAVGGTRATLGDLLRRALGRDGAGVVDLLDALDALGAPAARALVGRVLGGELLLVVVTARDGAIARADARACRGRGEARALVDAFLGGGVADWAEGYGVASAGAVRAPALARGLADDGAPAPDAPALPGGGELTVVLPFLSLDDASAAAAQAALHTGYAGHLAAPAILGGTLRPGAAFLDAPAPSEADEDAPADEADDEADDESAPDDRGALDARWDAPADDDHADDEDADDEDPDDLDDAFDEDGDPTAARPPAAASARPAAIDADDTEAATPDFGGALDRAHARAATPVERVSALIATDDGVAEHVADAAAWLADASEQELRALARDGWAGDAALDVAHALAADDPEAMDVVQQARRHEAELVVEIDGRAAAAWLARHRPDVARRLGALL